MRQFLFGTRQDQHVFDLSKCVAGLRRVMYVLQDLTKDNCRILFVGNNDVTREIVGSLVRIVFYT